MISDIIVVAVIVLVIGGAVAYILREKKRGKKCVGCPYGNSCSENGNSCSCHGNSEDK